MTRKGLVYKATNSSNGKIYVGKTVKALQIRRAQHEATSRNSSRPTGFHGAIRKYGVSGFTWEVLHECEASLLNTLEVHYIESLRSNITGVGYNLTSGGDGAAFGDQNVSKRPEVREKLRVASTGYKHTPKSLAVMSHKSKEFYKGGMSLAQREKISRGLLASSIRKPSHTGGDHCMAKGCTLISPEGAICVVKGYREFAVANGLDHSAISKLANGKLLTHRGWRLALDT